MSSISDIREVIEKCAVFNETEEKELTIKIDVYFLRKIFRVQVFARFKADDDEEDQFEIMVDEKRQFLSEETFSIGDFGNYTSKEQFIEQLKSEIRIFSLVKYEHEILICDKDKRDNDQILYAPSCRSLFEKVLFETGLSPLNMLEIKSEDFQAEMYLFILPFHQYWKFQNAIITPDFLNQVYVESFSIELSKTFPKIDNVAFIAKIQSDNHLILKNFIKYACDFIRKHQTAGDNELETDNPPKTVTESVIDLTENDSELDHQEKNDDVWYWLITKESHSKCDDKLLCKYLDEANTNDEYERVIIFFKDEDQNQAFKSTEQHMEAREVQLSKQGYNSRKEILFTRITHHSFSSLKVPTLNCGKRQTIVLSPEPTKQRKTVPSSSFFNKRQVQAWLSSKRDETRNTVENRLNKSFMQQQDNVTFNKLVEDNKNKREIVQNFTIPRKSKQPSSVTQFIDLGSDQNEIDENESRASDLPKDPKRIFKDRRNTSGFSQIDFGGKHL